MTTPGFSRIAHVAVATLACLFLGTALAQDVDPPGRVGRIAEIQGTVWRYDADEAEWVAASRNRPVTTGDRLSTEAGARAEVQIGSSTLRLNGATEIEVRQLDDEHVRVYLATGDIALRLRASDVAREFEVETDAGRFLPGTAGHMRIEREGRSSFGGVWSGSMRFDTRDSALDINAGQRAEFWEDNGTTHYTWASAQNDGFSQWALAQDRQDERNALQARDISPEMTGVEDLDRYGRWDTHPEYGAIWAPTSVAAGWAPYRDGHWAWVNPWGWTWVDDAPWGFAPFHYGRWVDYRGRWVWAPGRYASRPVYAPALVGWIGGSGVSVGVTIGGGRSRPPYVGWVPLAPREPYMPGYRVRQRDYEPYYGPGRRPQGWRPPVQSGPVRYSNEGLPGGVTVVPSDVLRERRPVAGRVVADPRVVREVVGDRGPGRAPAAPPTRVVTVPGGAVPVSPAFNNGRPGGTRDGFPPRMATPGGDAYRGQGLPQRDVSRDVSRDGARDVPRDLSRDGNRDVGRDAIVRPATPAEVRVAPAPSRDAYRGGDRPQVQLPSPAPAPVSPAAAPREAFRGGDNRRERPANEGGERVRERAEQAPRVIQPAVVAPRPPEAVQVRPPQPVVQPRAVERVEAPRPAQPSPLVQQREQRERTPERQNQRDRQQER
jgi:hypothetical protein